MEDTAPPLYCFCINLDERTDRWEEVQAAFEGSGIQIQRFPGVKHAEGWKGCAASHIAVAAEAQKRAYPWVLVLEDDCIPRQDFIQRWAGLKRELWKTRGSWDIFLGGPTCIDGPLTPIGKDLWELDKAYSLHLYILNASAYGTVQKWEADRHGPIDVYTSDSLRMAVTYPGIAIQRASVSDIQGAFRDYEDHFEESDKEILKLLYALETRGPVVTFVALSALVLWWFFGKKGGRRG